ncbi:MAG: O-antigen ligase family protein [Acidobacteriota bacterium]
MNFANKTIFYLICACIVLSTLAYGTVHQPTLAIFYAAIALMVVLWAYDCYSRKAIRYSSHMLQIPLYAAAVYGFFQIIPFGSSADVAGLSAVPRTISAAPFLTEMSSLHFLALGFFLSIALIYIDSARRLRQMVGLVAIFGFTFAFFAILQSVLSPTKIYGIFERATPFGSFVNRHNFAAFIEMSLAVPLGLMLTGAVERDKKLLYIIAIVLMGSSLLLSGSRGGLIAMLAAVCLLIVLTTRARGAKALALKAALSVLMLGAVVAGAVFVGGETSFTRIAETASSNDITTDRSHIWLVTTKVIAANLPLGAGFGAFGQAYTPYDNFNGLERVEQAHNDYLQVLADAGIVGVLIGGMFLFLIFSEARKNLNVTNAYRRGVAVGAIGGIFAVLVHSLFDFVLHTTAVSIMFLTLIAMLVAAGRKFADDVRDEHDPRLRPRHASVAPFGAKIL